MPPYAILSPGRVWSEAAERHWRDALGTDYARLLFDMRRAPDDDRGPGHGLGVGPCGKNDRLCGFPLAVEASTPHTQKTALLLESGF